MRRVREESRTRLPISSPTPTRWRPTGFLVLQLAIRTWPFGLQAYTVRSIGCVSPRFNYGNRGYGGNSRSGRLKLPDITAKKMRRCHVVPHLRSGVLFEI